MKPIILFKAFAVNCKYILLICNHQRLRLNTWKKTLNFNMDPNRHTKNKHKYKDHTKASNILYWYSENRTTNDSSLDFIDEHICDSFEYNSPIFWWLCAYMFVYCHLDFVWTELRAWWFLWEKVEYAFIYHLLPHKAHTTVKTEKEREKEKEKARQMEWIRVSSLSEYCGIVSYIHIIVGSYTNILTTVYYCFVKVFFRIFSAPAGT